MNKTLFLISDRHQSVLRVAQDAFAYTPHGHSGEASRGGRPGFAGELREALTGHYLLGSGYRAYNPVLMRFHSPDSWSPFGRGGMNAYAYCLGDPLNWRDPSGHVPLQALIGVAGLGLNTLTLGALTPLAITGMLLGAASVAVDVARHVGGRREDPLLGSMGLALGALSVGVGVLGVAGAGLRAGNVRRFWRRAPRPPKVDKLEVLDFYRVEGGNLEKMGRANPGLRRNLTQRLQPLPPWRRDQTIVDYQNQLLRIVNGEVEGYLPQQILGNPDLKKLVYSQDLAIDTSRENFIATYVRVKYVRAPLAVRETPPSHLWSLRT